MKPIKFRVRNRRNLSASLTLSLRLSWPPGKFNQRWTNQPLKIQFINLSLTSIRHKQIMKMEIFFPSVGWAGSVSRWANPTPVVFKKKKKKPFIISFYYQNIEINFKNPTSSSFKNSIPFLMMKNQSSSWLSWKIITIRMWISFKRLMINKIRGKAFMIERSVDVRGTRARIQMSRRLFPYPSLSWSQVKNLVSDLKHRCAAIRNNKRRTVINCASCGYRLWRRWIGNWLTPWWTSLKYVYQSRF